MAETGVVVFGFMNTSSKRLYSESALLSGQAGFIEIQVHDNLKGTKDTIQLYKVANDFDGVLTIHGEGETDGRKKIHFCAPNRTERTRYIRQSATLYSSVRESLLPYKVKRLVVHPDTLSRKLPRNQQIQYLAESLVDLSQNIHGIEVCIEPRGGDRQGKVLRAELEDLKTLAQCVNSNGGKLGLCIDVAQLFVVHGNNGATRFLEELKPVRLPVKEFHISDVSQTKKVTNRVAMEVGKGAIEWAVILPLLLQLCNELLIETLGGIKVFQRSKSYLESLVKQHEVLL